MALQNLPIANFFPLLSPHLRRKELLTDKAGDCKLCMGNTKSQACRQVIKSKGHHSDRSCGYTRYTQPDLYNLYNFNNVDKCLPGMCLIVSLAIPPCHLTKAWEKAYTV